MFRSKATGPLAPTQHPGLYRVAWWTDDPPTHHHSRAVVYGVALVLYSGRTDALSCHRVRLYTEADWQMAQHDREAA